MVEGDRAAAPECEECGAAVVVEDEKGLRWSLMWTVCVIVTDLLWPAAIVGLPCECLDDALSEMSCGSVHSWPGILLGALQRVISRYVFRRTSLIGWTHTSTRLKCSAILRRPRTLKTGLSKMAFGLATGCRSQG